MEGIEPKHAGENYDKTNVMDNTRAKNVHGLTWAKTCGKKNNLNKQAISVMFCRNTVRQFLFATNDFYKTKNLYAEWTR